MKAGSEQQSRESGHVLCVVLSFCRFVVLCIVLPMILLSVQRAGGSWAARIDGRAAAQAEV
jgi:hypothetical protein